MTTTIELTMAETTEQADKLANIYRKQGATEVISGHVEYLDDTGNLMRVSRTKCLKVVSQNHHVFTNKIEETKMKRFSAEQI